ncbi:MAG: hypothetical protein AAF944_26960 [Bacteroidota bacterium]
MVVNENAVGKSQHLVDEQAKWKLESLSFQPQSIWRPDFSWNEPLHLAIDLQSTYQVQSVALYRDADFLDDIEGKVSVYYGEPFDWKPLLERKSLERNKWQQLIFEPAETQFLRIKIEGGKVNLGELFCFGDLIGQSTFGQMVKASAINVPEKTTFDEMLGINAFIDDPIGRLDYFGFIREYHNWRWVEHEDDAPYPNNINHWSPGDSKWDFDQFYRNMHTADILACPSVKENLKWLRRNHWEINTRPALPEDDANDPSSYIAHADHMFQYAARYGARQVADSLLKLADDQVVKSGLGYLQYFENWNEQNIWWKGRAEYFTPYEFAAMSSADYDGHMQELGNTIGLKNADPEAKLVMSGLASLNLDYVKAMKFWSDHHRNGSFPADVLNFHHYSRYQKGSERYAISPEDDSLQTQLEELVAYRNQHLPTHELWLTEFGYDTNPNSPQGVPTIGNFTNEEVQGIWLVRSLLAISAAGIDRASIYMLRDVKDGDPSLYNTSGVTSSKQSGWQPKPAWYYLKTITNCLQGMQFEQVIPTKQKDVFIYKFTRQHSSESRPESAYVIWSGTSEGKVIDGYQLELLPQEKYGLVVELSSNNSTVQNADIQQFSKITSLSVMEKPTVVLVNDQMFNKSLFTADKRYKIELTPSMLSFDDPSDTQVEGMLGLVDEQGNVGNPIMGGTTDPKTNWKTTKIKLEAYPYSAYLDLGSVANVNIISLFDANNEGDFSISVGEPDNWQIVATDRLQQYKKWSHHIVNSSTRYIRLTKHSSSANVGEVVIYAQKQE